MGRRAGDHRPRLTLPCHRHSERPGAAQPALSFRAARQRSDIYGCCRARSNGLPRSWRSQMRCRGDDPGGHIRDQIRTGQMSFDGRGRYRPSAGWPDGVGTNQDRSRSVSGPSGSDRSVCSSVGGGQWSHQSATQPRLVIPSLRGSFRYLSGARRVGLSRLQRRWNRLPGIPARRAETSSAHVRTGEPRHAFHRGRPSRHALSFRSAAIASVLPGTIGLVTAMVAGANRVAGIR